jgi:integral membrane protein (TIGR01906 family)
MDMDENAPPAGDALDNGDRQDQNRRAGAAGRQRGTHMGFARSLATIIFILALPIAIVSSNVRILLNAPVVYDYAFDRYNAEDTTGLSRADLDGTASDLRDYFNNGEQTFYRTVTAGGLTVPVFNARETRHMEDVKSLVVWMDRLQELTVIYVLAYVVGFVIWSREGSLRQLAKESLIAVTLGAIVVGGIAIFASLGFEAAFTRFHELFFSNDLWQLNPRTDRLIQMFPEDFWRDMTVLLGGMCAIEAAVIAAISGMYLVATRGERRRLMRAIDVNTSTTQAA